MTRVSSRSGTATRAAHARSLLSSEDLAWDAVQEVLLRAWRRGPLPDDPGPFLRGCTQLASAHMRRTLSRRRHHEERAGRLDAPAEAPSPLLTCQRHETCRILQEALSELVPEHREVLVLRELSGLQYGAIARRLGLPTGTVRSRLHRARERLREVLLRRCAERGW